MRVGKDPCADCRTPPTETNWLAIFFALAAVVYSGAHCIGYDFEYLQHYFHFARSPHVRTTVAVLQRLAIDFIRFVLAILLITLILVLECKKALFYLANNSWHVCTMMQLATATTQTSLDNGFALRVLSLVPFCVEVFLSPSLLILFHGPPDFEDSSPVSKPEIRPYIVPNWVILARPENRYHDRSNCHYRPGDECLVLERNHNSRLQSLELQSAGLQSPNIVLGSNVKQLYISEGALGTLKSEDTIMIDNDTNITTTRGTTIGSHGAQTLSLEAENDGQSTVTVAHIQAAWHTQIEI